MTLYVPDHIKWRTFTCLPVHQILDVLQWKRKGCILDSLTTLTQFASKHILNVISISFDAFCHLIFTGLLQLRGANYKISRIELHSNCISDINHLLQCLSGLQYLTNLSLEKNGKNNPVCAKIGKSGARGIIVGYSSTGVGKLLVPTFSTLCLLEAAALLLHH